MIGKTISHYHIIKKLGEGGMGIVYKAEDTKLNRDVAIKFLPRQIATSEEERERFKIEAQAAASLNHSNIATIHAIEDVDDEVFIIMEYIEGQELKSLIDNNQLPIDNVLNYAAQITAGLQAAHEKGITHRDVKSANILITDKGQVKIMDFGLAKVHGGPQVTKVGTTLGTVAYMSPEQLRGKEADFRSDIWAFGVVLYEMLTGKLPFGGDYEQAVIYAILNEEPNPLSNLRPEIPESLQKVVSRALEKDPARRFQTAEDLLTSLGKVSKQEYSPTLTTDRLKRKVFTFRPWYAAFLLALVLFIVVGLIYIFNRQEDPFDTLAILPFANQSDDQEMEYLSDGIAETLIFKLSQLPNLKVRSLSSALQYKGKSPDLQKVGVDLNVRAVLTGRVTVRKDKLAIVVELVDTQDNSTIWGDTYNRSLADLITVQDEISNNILTRMRLELTGEARKKVSKRYTDNAEAYQAYLKGRYFTHKRSEDNLRRAIEYYRQAIDISPLFAAAYAGLSETYFLLGIYGLISRDEALPKAKKAAQKALEIDDALSEAHASHGIIEFFFNWDFSTAEKEMKRAIELNPNNVDAHHHYSYMLSYTGRNDEAIQKARIALELDPLSSVMTRGLALAYFYARQYDQALKYYQDCLEINPNSLAATFNLFFVYHQLGFQDQSIAMLEKYHRLISEETHAALIKQNYEHLGFRYAVRELLGSREVGIFNDHSVKAWLFAMIGENERCLESLQRAYEERSSFLPNANVHPSLDPVRSDPCFIAIMDKIYRQK